MANYTGLTDLEIDFLARLFNKYSGQSPIADSTNYQYIVPSYAKEILKKYKDDKKSTIIGKTMADNIIEKITKQGN